VRTRCVLVAAISCWLIASGLSGCVRVPQADMDAVAPPKIDAVVRRVKCDLITAFQPVLENPTNAWLQTWVAQASLTYIVNDASTLTPGATLTQPLSIVSIPGKLNNFGTSANLGLGAGYNTTASRNETMTFSLSLQEIADKRLPLDFCNYEDATDLQSQLGLDEWVHQALSPTRSIRREPGGPSYAPSLSQGHHKTSKVGAGPSGSSGASATSTTPAAPSATPGAAGFNAAQITTLKALRDQLKSAPPPPPPGRSRKLTRLLNAITADKMDLALKLDDILKSEIDDPTTVITTAVSGVSPQQGSSLGHTHVVIIGANFEKLDTKSENPVTIGGQPLVGPRVAKGDSTVCGFTPAHSDTNKNGVDVVVTTTAGAGTKIGGFNYIAPTVTLVQSDGTTSNKPPTLTVAPPYRDSDAQAPTDVTIAGYDFRQAANVTFGGAGGANANIKNQDEKSITVTAPMSDAVGLVDVVVTMVDKTKLTINNGFTYNNIQCPKQDGAKRKIIAYVDQVLGKKIDGTLFKTRALINLIEAALQRVPFNGDDWANLNSDLQSTKATQDLLLTIQLDPPLDAIGHQVQFLIVYTGNISPSWTLVNFKGPSPSTGTGFSATKTRTHTLNIAVGPPGSPDVANTLGALQLGTAIGNSLGVNGLAVPLAVP